METAGTIYLPERLKARMDECLENNLAVVRAPAAGCKPLVLRGRRDMRQTAISFVKEVKTF